MDNQQLNRYVGDYYKFQEVYEMKQAQMKAAYDKQQKEIADLKDLLQEIRPGLQQEIWLCQDRKA